MEQEQKIKNIINKLEKVDLLETFWMNLDEYIKNDTVLEEIDNTFPEYFVENYDIYQELFNQQAEYLHKLYKERINEKIDFNIKYSDAFKYIINGLKETYINQKDIYQDDIENIINEMYEDKYIDHLKNKGIGQLIALLRNVKYFC